jgi:hypothetical protein
MHPQSTPQCDAAVESGREEGLPIEPQHAQRREEGRKGIVTERGCVVELQRKTVENTDARSKKQRRNQALSQRMCQAGYDDESISADFNNGRSHDK